MTGEEWYDGFYDTRDKIHERDIALADGPPETVVTISKPLNSTQDISGGPGTTM